PGPVSRVRPELFARLSSHRVAVQFSSASVYGAVSADCAFFLYEPTLGDSRRQECGAEIKTKLESADERPAKSGRGQPHSKTCRSPRALNIAKRLGVRLPSAAFAIYPPFVDFI